MSRMTNKRAREIVNEWLTTQGKTPPPDTLDYLSYAHACRLQYSGKYPDTIDTRQTACRLIREFAQLVLDMQEDERIRTPIRSAA